MVTVINQLKSKAKSQSEFLKLTYDFIGNRYRTGRFRTITKFHYLFKSADEIWPLPGFAPCQQSNYLLKIFLVKSGWFKIDEIKTKNVFLNFFLHQYLKVRVGSNWLDVDVGEKQKGMPLGKHLSWFG